MAESDKKKILATIFCLKEDSAYDDKARFNEFWGDVEDCEIFDNETEKWSESNFDKSLNKVKETFGKGNYDCLVLAVSSHGKEKDNGNEVSFEIVWTHRAMGQKYKIDRLFEHFDKTDKMKIFLLQMCRNRNEDTVTKDGTDHGVSHSSTFPDLRQPSNPKSDTLHQSQSEGSFLKETNVVWPKTWKLAQACIKNSIAFFSAPSGFKSYTRNNNSNEGGGWLFLCMRKLIKDIKKQKMSVMDLFLMVNKEMSQMETTKDEHVVLSSFNHMLTEDIFINIK